MKMLFPRGFPVSFAATPSPMSGPVVQAMSAKFGSTEADGVVEVGVVTAGSTGREDPIGAANEGAESARTLSLGGAANHDDASPDGNATHAKAATVRCAGEGRIGRRVYSHRF